MAAAIPRAKLIAIIRDPVDRAYSNWTHLRADGLEPEADFRREAASIGITPKEIGIVTGLNYTRGRWVTLILYQTAS